jgi:hypothetical protein
LVFKDGEGVHYWFLKGDIPLTKCVPFFLHCPLFCKKNGGGGGGGVPTIAFYFTFLENVSKIMNTKLIMILE